MRHRNEGQPIQRRFLYRSPATHQPQAQFGILGSFRRKFVKLASRTTLRFSRYTLPFPEFSSILDISTSIDAAGCCDHLTMDRALFKMCSYLGRTQAFLPGEGESFPVYEYIKSKQRITFHNLATPSFPSASFPLLFALEMLHAFIKPGPPTRFLKHFTRTRPSSPFCPAKA